MSDPHAIRTLEQFLAIVNAGEFRDDFYEKWKGFWDAMHTHCVVHDLPDAKGKVTLTLNVEIDRFGEIETKAKAEFEIPKPPTPTGRGRAYLGKNGELTRHPQGGFDFVRDVSAPEQPMRDPEAKTGA